MCYTTGRIEVVRVVKRAAFGLTDRSNVMVWFCSCKWCVVGLGFCSLLLLGAGTRTGLIQVQGEAMARCGD